MTPDARPSSGDASPPHGLVERLRSFARNPVGKAVGFVAGLALVGSAVFFAASQPGLLTDSLHALRAAPWWLLALAVLLPVANALVVALSLQSLTLTYGRVGRFEMCALVSTAWLLNYLPLRPGMVGRLAYHRAVNGVRVRDSVRVMVVAAVLTTVGTLHLLALGLVVSTTGWGPGAWAVVALPVVLIIGGCVRFGGGRLAMQQPSERLAWVVLLRYIDLAIWAGRYAVLFAVIGHPVSLESALILAGVTQFSFFVPLIGNGLGVREWSVGLTTAFLAPAGTGSMTLAEVAAVGLAAEIVNRLAEVAGAIPAGLGGSAWIASRARNAGKSGNAEEPVSSEHSSARTLSEAPETASEAQSGPSDRG